MFGAIANAAQLGARRARALAKCGARAKDFAWSRFRLLFASAQ